MNYKFDQQAKKTARVRTMFLSALVLACAFGTVSNASAQRVTPPETPTDITVPEGNSAYLVGHAFGSQGYSCLPTSTGGTAWNPNARPEATLFSDFFGQQFQIITHFQSINENPKEGVTVPRSGNVTWQSSLDSSRVWAVKVNGINPDPTSRAARIPVRFNASCCSPSVTRGDPAAEISWPKPHTFNA